MKLEIEITEAEIRSAVERKIRVAVADQSNNWGADEYIKREVKAQWHTAVDALILEALNDSQALRDKIAAELERKLRAQLAAAMKSVGRDGGSNDGDLDVRGAPLSINVQR